MVGRSGTTAMLKSSKKFFCGPDIFFVFFANQRKNRLSNQVSGGEKLFKQGEKSGFIALVQSIQYSCTVLSG